MRAGQQDTRLEEVAVRVGRVTHALDLHRVTAPGREQVRHVDKVVRDGKIVEIDALADTERLRQLDLAVLDD